jgi:hypothetical protein
MYSILFSLVANSIPPKAFCNIHAYFFLHLFLINVTNTCISNAMKPDFPKFHFLLHKPHFSCLSVDRLVGVEMHSSVKKRSNTPKRASPHFFVLQKKSVKGRGMILKMREET